MRLPGTLQAWVDTAPCPLEDAREVANMLLLIVDAPDQELQETPPTLRARPIEDDPERLGVSIDIDRQSECLLRILSQRLAFGLAEYASQEPCPEQRDTLGMRQREPEKARPVRRGELLLVFEVEDAHTGHR
jgi:hypothetical protein